MMLTFKFTFKGASICLVGLVALWVVYAYSLLPYFLALIVGSTLVYVLYGEDLNRQGSETITNLWKLQDSRRREDSKTKMPFFSFLQGWGATAKSEPAKEKGPRQINTRRQGPSTSRFEQNENSGALSQSFTMGHKGEPNSSINRNSLNNSTHVPNRRFNDSGRLNRSAMSPATLTSPFHGLSLIPGPRSSDRPLPKVQRVGLSPMNASLNSPVTGRPPLVGHRRYPTHQAKYDSVGILPTVKLHTPSRAVLGENHSMISPVTVKVAPPDVLKQPTPIIIQVNQAPPQAEAVMSALREKRKRNNVDEDAQAEAQAVTQELKRRRHLSDQQPTEEESMVLDQINTRPPTKRPAESESEHESDEEENAPKRVRTESGTSEESTHLGPRNPIEISYSSSRRWLEKQSSKVSTTDDDSSEPRMYERVTRSKSRERTLGFDVVHKGARRPPIGAESTPCHSGRNTPIRLGQALRDLKDDDEPMAERGTATSNTPNPCSSGRSTPSYTFTGSELDDSFSKSNPKKRLVLLKKEGSSKRRPTPLHSDIADKLSKLPQLRYSLTVDDFENDRIAERERVKQMMDEIEEAHKQHLEKKAAKQASITPAKTTAQESTAVPPATGKSVSASLTTQTTVTASGISTTAMSSGFKSPSTSISVGSSIPSTTSASASATSAASATTKPGLTIPAGTGTTATAATSAAAGGFKFGETIKSTPVSGTKPSEAPKPATVGFGLSAASSSTAAPSTGGFSATSAVAPASSSGVTTTLFTQKPTPSEAPGAAKPTGLAAVMFGNTATSNAPAPAASTNTNTFGSTGLSLPKVTAASSSATQATGMFGGGTVAGSNGPSVTFGAAKSTASSAGGFQFGSSIPSGAPKTTVPQPAGGGMTFGAGTDAAKPAAPSMFGSSASSTASPSTFGHHSHSAPSLTKLVSTSSAPAFGGVTSSQAASSGMTFGATSKPSSGSTPSFNFGAPAAATTTSNAPASTFTFGQKTGGSVGNLPQFGGNASTSNPPAFGQSSASTAAPNATAPSSMFGQSSQSSGFGSNKSSNSQGSSGFAFGAQKNAPVATTTAASSSGFSFGQKPQASSSTFGSSASTPSFGAANQSQSNSAGMFGGGAQNQKPAFGSTQNQASGFNFGSSGTQQSTFGSSAPAFGQATNNSATPANKGSSNFNFGGGATPGGSTGNTGGMPTPNFNFGAGNAGASFTGQPQQGQSPAPAFGGAAPPQTPNNNMGAGNMFNIGQTNVAPQRRAPLRAQRRAAVRRR